jgi:hypothetical protein
MRKPYKGKLDKERFNPKGSNYETRTIYYSHGGELKPPTSFLTEADKNIGYKAPEEKIYENT